MSWSWASNSYQGRYAQLTIDEAVNYENNTSTLNWTFTVAGGSSSYYTIAATNIVINGTTVYSVGETSYRTYAFPAAKGSVSGSITVNHNNDGSASVYVSFTTRIYYSGAQEYAGSTISLTKISRYTVSYDSNGGTSIPSSQIKVAGVSLTLAGAISRNNTSAYGYTVTLDGNGASTAASSLQATDTVKYAFAGWNTNSSGTGDNYAAYGTYTKDADVILYAKWSTSRVYGTVTLPSLVRTGYIFKGWAETKTVSSGATGSYTPTKNVTLYAIWEARGLVHIDDGSKWNDYQIYVDNGSSWEVYAPYIDTGTGWELYS